jgi:hypothetical protein
LFDFCFRIFLLPDMVECLSSMSGLEEFEIDFQPSLPVSAEQTDPRLLIPTILLVLTTLSFEGAYRYLYHILAHIDAPLLESVRIEFINSAIFDVSQFAPFIGRTEAFEAFKHARIFAMTSCSSHFLPKQGPPMARRFC